MVDRGNFTNIMNDLTFVDNRVRAHAPVDLMTPLSSTWEPNAWSVICGRGKECFDHVGNRRFRVLVDANLMKYQQARSKFDKTMIVMGILDAIREASQGGGFVKQDPSSKRWFEVGDTVAREKIGQQFRVALKQNKNRYGETHKKRKVTKKKIGGKSNKKSTLSTPMKPVTQVEKNTSRSLTDKDSTTRLLSPCSLDEEVIMFLNSTSFHPKPTRQDNSDVSKYCGTAYTAETSTLCQKLDYSISAIGPEIMLY